jgi:hypothetical protein
MERAIDISIENDEDGRNGRLQGWRPPTFLNFGKVRISARLKKPF